MWPSWRVEQRHTCRWSFSICQSWAIVQRKLRGQRAGEWTGGVGWLGGWVSGLLWGCGGWFAWVDFPNGWFWWDFQFLTGFAGRFGWLSDRTSKNTGSAALRQNDFFLTLVLAFLGFFLGFFLPLIWLDPTQCTGPLCHWFLFVCFSLHVYFWQPVLYAI
jgi:hypothetical protein